MHQGRDKKHAGDAEREGKPPPTSLPKILVSVDLAERPRRGVNFPTLALKAAYASRIADVGGLPLLIAPTDRIEIINELAATMDGLLITGGAFDIPPEYFGDKATPGIRLDVTKPERTRFEWRLLERALALHVPVLGVCGGMQLLNVVLGGSLYQDVSAQLDGALEHEQASSPEMPDHTVEIDETSPFAHVVKTTQLEVNSTHHQGVLKLGARLAAMAHSPDGLVEAIGLADDPLATVLGVQWHPELLPDPASRAIYAHFISRSRDFAAKRHLSPSEDT